MFVTPAPGGEPGADLKNLASSCAVGSGGESDLLAGLRGSAVGNKIPLLLPGSAGN